MVHNVHTFQDFNINKFFIIYAYVKWTRVIKFIHMKEMIAAETFRYKEDDKN